MTFREWMTHHGELFWEFGDINKMDTSHVTLEPLPAEQVDDFDESDAESDCQDEIGNSWDSSDYQSDIYDDPLDDPDFSGQTADDWADDNPRPDEEDEQWYTTKPKKQRWPLQMAGDPEPEEDDEDDRTFKQEEFQAAVKQWEQDYEYAEQEYNDAVEEWERDMRRKRRQADRDEEQAKEDTIRDCVEQKREEYEENRPETAENGGYESHFTHDGKPYEVSLNREKEDYQGVEIPGFFSVVFEGPAGTSSTGTAGTAATAIYTQLLLSVKKLIEVETVNGFSFSPAEPAMGLVYQRFYKQFLQPAGFIRINMNDYLKKDYLKELLKKKADSEKKRVYGKIIDTNRDVQYKIKAVEADKAKVRAIRRGLPNMVGKLHTFTNGWGEKKVFYATEAEAGKKPKLSGYIMPDSGGMPAAGSSFPVMQTIDPSYIKNEPVDPNEAKRLLSGLNYMRQNPNNERLLRQGFNELLDQYGIQYKKDTAPYTGPNYAQTTQTPEQPPI